MSTIAVPGPTTLAPGGAIGTPASPPHWVTTTSLCTGHETVGLCSTASTIGRIDAPGAVDVTTTVGVPPLPATGASPHDAIFGGALIAAGIILCRIGAAGSKKGRRLW